ncbi:hypothetical protein G7Y89_g608 [Cudoniella acicularis]|uniref:Efflux pump dotC n=1 Tax=Cudoniella acicularis TaxID=354080 RepID=A0A8H4WA90_9HELO|nr:hypothetical protein G7Y89_g608 [Cudoniella acicularis]
MDNLPSSLPTSAILMSTLALVHHHETSSESRSGSISSKKTPATILPMLAASPSEVSARQNQEPNASINSLPAPNQQEAETEDESRRAKLPIAIIMSSLCACVFVAAVDITIISTALPAIAGNFHSATGYQWIGSAYVLGSTASTPSWGKISDIWGRKSILLLGILIFFAGSLICALSQSMAVFLAGRAIQGVGASGLLTLVNIAISDLFSMRDRSLYFGVTSLVWALASGVGPVLGGVFAQQLSWRWCFWLNLPIAGLVFVFLFFFMPQDNPGTPVLTGLKAIDWSGSLLIIGSTLILLLGLNFGGVTFSWSSATIINLIIFGIFAGFLFGINEWKLVKYPVIPISLFHSRSSSASFAVCFCHGFVMMGVAYYLPLYFQAVLGAGPLLSGVYLLPFIFVDTGMAAATGVYIQMTGKYISAVYIGLVLMTLGTGLLINLDVEANWYKIVGYQILVGAGVGMNFEGPLLALQASVDVRDVAAATATIGFTRTLSTAVSAIIGGVVFQNQMVKEAPLLASLGPEVASLLKGGSATANVDVIKTLPLDQQLIARIAFCRSLRAMWIAYVAFAALALLAGCFIGIHTLSKDLQPLQIGLVSNETATNAGTGGQTAEESAEREATEQTPQAAQGQAAS